MEAFEAIRDSAALLHRELVSPGIDPAKPMALVEAALSRFDLEVFWLKPEDPALKGARAVFDEQSGSIFCEEVADIGERALLIGHEIGHVRVHATSFWCDANDVDPSRSTEAAPVGLQRVEDYGVRERRELQANVFAREFLLPRSWARQLYLENRLGAGAIAERTGLPKNLIRQQLFDALLLPAPSEAGASESEPKRSIVPDSSQTRAAAHRGSPFQLQAGPGTGKTRTLVDRVASLIAEGIDPSAILVLTFSNRAAGELAERIAAAVPEAAPRIWIGTFHAFGLDLVRRYHDRLGLPPDPTLFDRTDAIEVLEEILPTLPLVHYRNLWDPALVLRDILSAISRAKDEMADPVRYRALAQTMAERATDEDERVAAQKCLEVAHVYDMYEQAMRERGSVDFGDLIMRPALLLESDSSLRVALRLRHRHILVDEYQDVNRASGRLLKTVAGDGKHLWVVGDSRQSIYRFRGASSSNMALFASDYPNATSDQLLVNYRSTSQVVTTFVAVAPRMGASTGMLPLALTAERGNGPANPEIRRFDTLEDEAEGLAASIREVEARGVSLRDQAVLCRTNSRLNESAEALEARGIPVLHLGSLFEREEIRDLLALLSLAVDRFGTGLARIGAMPRYELSLQDVYLATSQLREAERPALTSLSGLATTPGLSMSGAEGLTRLASDLEGLSSSLSSWDFLSEYLLDRSELVREIARRQSVPDQMRAVAVWQFLNFVREQSPVSSGFRIQRTLDRVRQLVLLAEERDLRQVPTGALHMNAVRLMTVHGSKGLEFEAVHIPGLTSASFPSSNRGQRCPPPVGMIEGVNGLTVAEEARQSHEHEEQCLFFVALSRARTHLRIYLARLQPNGNNRSPSVFLDWMPAQVVVEIAKPRKMALPGGTAGSSAVMVTRSADSSITDSSLTAYLKCPRRYFYTHILGLGTARKSTAFLRTHNCLYDLIQWLAETRRDGDPTIEAAEQFFESIWKERGPVDHGFASDYRRLASRLISALVKSGAGRRFRDAEPIAIDFPNGRISVEPNEMAQLPNGTVVLRRVRTGHKRSDEYDSLEYTLYHLAGKARFGNAFSVEAIHLTDETVETVTITAQKLNNRRATSDDMLQNISRGLFPPKPDAVACPRCPHFFICDAIPKGELQLT
jgi:DNA helicase II / ATP-dependent DNA helicase PcrA